MSAPSHPTTLAIISNWSWVETIGMNTKRLISILICALGLCTTATLRADESRIHEWRFFSEALQQEMPMSVVAPEQAMTDTPVLVFLHGRGRHHRSLLEVERCRKQLLAADMWVILPQGEDGWYINSPVQPEARYEDYLSEVIEQAKQRFDLAQSPDRWAIGGWSMGGYGAMRFAVRHPGQFGTVATVVGLLDFPREKTLPEGQNYTVPLARFGADLKTWRAFNPINVITALRGKSVLLITADAAFDRTMNENFSAALIEAKVGHHIITLEGAHTFPVVQESLPLVLDFVRTRINQ